MENNEELKKCRLCGEYKKLIKAHVIPEWAFRYLYPDDIEEKKIPIFLVKKDGMARSPIGPYDSNLLCQSCDSYLGGFDDYGKKILLDAPFVENGRAFFLISGVDFEKLQLFLLSMAWRSSISSKEAYERVSIGPYEGRIKELLLKKAKGLSVDMQNNYSFVIAKFNEGNLPHEVVNKNIQIPHIQKIKGVNIVVFYMPRGLKIFLKLDKRKFPDKLEDVFNNQQEGLRILRLGNYSDSPEFKSMLDAID